MVLWDPLGNYNMHGLPLASLHAKSRGLVEEAMCLRVTTIHTVQSLTIKRSIESLLAGCAGRDWSSRPICSLHGGKTDVDDQWLAGHWGGDVQGSAWSRYSRSEDGCAQADDMS